MCHKNYLNYTSAAATSCCLNYPLINHNDVPVSKWCRGYIFCWFTSRWFQSILQELRYKLLWTILLTACKTGRIDRKQTVLISNLINMRKVTTDDIGKGICSNVLIWWSNYTSPQVKLLSVYRFIRPDLIGNCFCKTYVPLYPLRPTNISTE